MGRKYYGEADDPNDPYDDSNQNMYPDVNAGGGGIDSPAPANDEPAPSPSPGPAPGPGPGPGGPGGPGGGGGGGTGGYTGALPPGVTQAQADAWLAQNQGDSRRIFQAFGNSTSRPDAPKGNGGRGGMGTGADGTSAILSALLDSILHGGALSGVPQGGYQASPENQALRAQTLAALQEMIRQGQEPVGDVGNTPQARANRIATQRAYERTRSESAERRASQGLLYSGPFEQDLAGAQQTRAESQGKFEAQLVQTILTDRKERLTSALQMSAGLLSEDQRANLQRELQQVNAALQQTQIQLLLSSQLFQNQQFYDKLGYDLGGQEGAANAHAVGK